MIRTKIANNNSIENVRDFEITRARRTADHGMIQLNGNILFAVNFKTQEWKVFDRHLKEWIEIETTHPYFNKYVIPILSYFQESYPFN